LSVQASISELCGLNAELNEIWTSVFGGFVAIFVCGGCDNNDVDTREGRRRRGKGERGRSRRNERTHDRFRVKNKNLIPRWLSSTGIASGEFIYVSVPTGVLVGTVSTE